MRRRAALAGIVAFALASVATAPPPLHEVRPGETLGEIAHATLGDSDLWPALYRANRDQIRDPSRLHPGQKLSIPTLSPEQRDAARREAQVHTLQ
jgi:nucleoid-associated protein YgaU